MMALRRSSLRHVRSLGLACGICLVSPSAVPTAHAQAPPPPSSQSSQPFTDRMNEFPSLWQEDPRAAFPGGGTKFCMPVAASNALMWLADHGYPKLLPDPSVPRTSEADRAAQQIALVKAFTAPPYASMKEDHGASLGWIAHGIGRYIKDRGYAVDQLDWRPVIAPAPGSAAVPAPGSQHSFTLDEIKSALRTGACVWISIGRFKPLAGVPDTYERVDGHAMTLVGFGLDEMGHPDPNVLIVHDPINHKDNPNWPNNRWHLGIMGGGHQAGKGADLNKPGKSMVGGYVFLTPQGALPKNGRFILLEEATVLRLRPATAASAPP